MSQSTTLPLRDRVTDEQGIPVCPKCGYEAESGMDEWMTHVSDEHDPIDDWAARWDHRRGGNP